MANNMPLCLKGYAHSLDFACRLGYRVGKKSFSYSQNEVVDLNHCEAKKKVKKETDLSHIL